MLKTGMINLVMAVILFFVFPAISDAQEKPIYGLAVLDLQAIGISETEALSLSEILRTGISRVLIEQKNKIKVNYRLLERTQMEKILDQFEIQSKVCTDLECAVEFGKMFAVDQIIIGSIGLVGSTYTIIARIVDVKTSSIINIVNRKQRGEIDTIIDLMPLIGRELLTGEQIAAPPQKDQVTPKTITPPVTTAPATPSGRDQYLSVKGEPAVAEVALNGEKIGESPVDFRRVEPGRYTVSIDRAGFEPYREEAVVEPGGNKTISYRLVPHARILVDGSPEGATVYLDGSSIGVTPVTGYFVQKGRHDIKVQKDGYLEYTRSITLAPGEQHDIRFNLTALVSISVSGSPPGALVMIDGKEIGASPIEGRPLPEGNYTVKIVMGGYERHTESVTVSAGAPASVSYVLLPISKHKILTKSLVIPGSGQWYAERRGKGALIMLAQAAAIGGAVAMSLNASKERSNYDDAYDAYLSASTKSSLAETRSSMEDAYDKAKSADTLQLAAFGVVAAVYLYNVIDAVLTNPSVEVRPPSTGLRIEPRLGEREMGLMASVRF